MTTTLLLLLLLLALLQAPTDVLASQVRSRQSSDKSETLLYFASRKMRVAVWKTSRKIAATRATYHLQCMASY